MFQYEADPEKTGWLGIFSPSRGVLGAVRRIVNSKFLFLKKLTLQLGRRFFQTVPNIRLLPVSMSHWAVKGLRTFSVCWRVTFCYFVTWGATFSSDGPCSLSNRIRCAFPDKWRAWRGDFFGAILRLSRMPYLSNRMRGSATHGQRRSYQGQTL